MTQNEFISMLRRNFEILHEERTSSDVLWLDLALGDRVVAVELTRELIGVSVVELGTTDFRGHDRSFKGPAAAFAYIQQLVRDATRA
jgi:hypothetical protein